MVSTIIPGFLYLGPDPTLPSEEEKLHGLGVKSILNMAVECEDEIGIASRFEQYKKIGIQDTVEEMRVAQGLQEACAFLGQSPLLASAPCNALLLLPCAQRRGVQYGRWLLASCAELP